MENQVKNITIEKLFNEDLEKYTIIDLRSSEEADKEKSVLPLILPLKPYGKGLMKSQKKSRW